MPYNQPMFTPTSPYSWGDFTRDVLPVAAGALSTAGTIYTNKQNIEQSDKQMEFQERMSNTSAQRAVEDYRKAGLNPALAYDRGASTPSGAAATIGDPINSGISTAMSTKERLQTMKFQAQTQEESLRQIRAQTDKTRVEGRLAEIQQEYVQNQARKMQQDINFARILQPATQRLAETDAILRSLQIPGAENDAEFEKKYGMTKRGISTAADAAGVIGGILGATRTAKGIITPRR